MTLREHPDFRADFSQLVDLSEVSRLDLFFADMNTIHRVHDPFSKEAKRAVVAPGGGATFGLARMYQSIVDSEQFEVFRSLLDAISWLGLEVTNLRAASKKDLPKPESAQLKEGSTMDVPPGGPASFGARRKRGKGSTG